MSKLQTVRVRPVPGRLVLMPDRGYSPVPADGATVYLDAFYTRTISHGDLEVVPVAAVAEAATPPAAIPSTTSL